jgi:predicted DNA-binding transcriptional regulator AlpA
MEMFTPDRSAALWTVAPIRRGRLAMKTYEFSIIASGLDPQAEDFESRFYKAGCDDATISFQKGHIIIDFAREAESIALALGSAVRAVRAAGARVDRIEPDPLVSLSEIATRTGMSRAAMTLYSKGQRCEGFPAPIAKVTTDSPLWDWAEVARWLFQHQKLPREAALEAELVRQANEAIEHRELEIGAILSRREREYEDAL